MKKITTLCVLLLVSGCTSVSLDLGIGNDNFIDSGTNPRSVIRLRGDAAKCFGGPVTCFAEFDHHSSFRDGAPFNNNPEDLTNQYSIGVSIPLWRSIP